VKGCPSVGATIKNFLLGDDAKKKKALLRGKKHRFGGEY